MGNKELNRYFASIFMVKTPATYQNFKTVRGQRKDVLALVEFQRRFIRMIPGMKGLSYEELLRALGLLVMEFRGNIIEIYRMLRDRDGVNVEKMFLLVEEIRTLRHSLRMKGQLFRTEMRRNFLSQRVANLQNSLPQKAMETISLSVLSELVGFGVGGGILGHGSSEAYVLSSSKVEEVKML
eukprot:g35357.t1